MNYTRLIVVLILVLVIVYINQTMREGLDLLPPCPDGQVRIPGTDNHCAVPGSTAAPSSQPTCPSGSTWNGTECRDNTTGSFVFPNCPDGYSLLGSKCWGRCPGDTGNFSRGQTCPPVTSAMPSTGTPTNTATTRTLADVNKEIEYLKSIGLNEGSDNDSMKRLVAERASLGAPPPISTPPYSNNPSALANIPTPSMTCAAENFSSF